MNLKTLYLEKGYVKGGRPAFCKSEMDKLEDGLNQLLKLLKPGESTKEIREWHESSRYLYDICCNKIILDHVEQLIGADFFLWGSNFFIKEPRSRESIGWHQDAYYWPLRPIISLTVWLAFDDVDEENGAMRIIPKSHLNAVREHKRMNGEGSSALDLQCEIFGDEEGKSESLCLKRGEFSIHNDLSVHGSPSNPSARRRAGLTIRYSPTDVQCNLKINPHFKTHHMRGHDEFCLNPVGVVPNQAFARLYREHKSVEEVGKIVEEEWWSKCSVKKKVNILNLKYKEFMKYD